MEAMEKYNRIRKNAILLENTDFYYPSTDQVVSYSGAWITPGYKKKYSISEDKKRISFIDENNCWYVLPFTNEVLSILRSAGYKCAGFFVPGEKNSYPLYRRVHWSNLLKEAGC